jgi:hypothetical protein
MLNDKNFHQLHNKFTRLLPTYKTKTSSKSDTGRQPVPRGSSATCMNRTQCPLPAIGSPSTSSASATASDSSRSGSRCGLQANRGQDFDLPVPFSFPRTHLSNRFLAICRIIKPPRASSDPSCCTDRRRLSDDFSA